MRLIIDRIASTSTISFSFSLSLSPSEMKVFGFGLRGQAWGSVFGLVVFWFSLVEKRTPWSRRDSEREIPEASFLGTGTFTACSWQKLTVGQSAGSSSSQNRSGKNGMIHPVSSVPSIKCAYVHNSSFQACSLESFSSACEI